MQLLLYLSVCVMFQYIVDCVLSARSYSKLRVFKKLCYLSYFFSAISKGGPVSFVVFRSSCMFCFCGCVAVSQVD
jgi:hypothetical protein